MQGLIVIKTMIIKAYSDNKIQICAYELNKHYDEVDFGIYKIGFDLP